MEDMAATAGGSGSRKEKEPVKKNETEAEEKLVTTPARRNNDVGPSEFMRAGGDEGDRPETRPWGRLVAIDGSYGNIMLKGNEVFVGRADVSADSSFSKQHFRVWKDPGGSGCVRLEDLSKNGTLVNGQAVKKGAHVLIEPGDQLSLVSSNNEVPSYVFQMLSNAQCTLAHPKKRSRQSNVEAEGVPITQEGRGEKRDVDLVETEDPVEAKMDPIGDPASKKPKILSLGEDSLMCDICHEVWHDCVSTGPCNHNFCGGCLSPWLRKSNSCPTCRRDVEYVSKNYALRRIVEEFLNAREDMRRTPEDLAELDKMSLIQKDYVKLRELRKLSRKRGETTNDSSYSADFSDNSYLNSVSGTSSDSEEEDASGAGRCRQCMPASLGRFVCSEDQLHLLCGSCGQLMPAREDVEVFQKCLYCDIYYCDTYWRSQDILSRNGSPGCEHGNRITQLQDKVPSAQFSAAFGGNNFEVQVLENYLASHHISRLDLWKDCLTKLDAGVLALTEEHGASSAARSGQLPVTSSLPTCDICVETIWADLVYKYREKIPTTELPPEVVARENCWYGRECRTQFRNEAHARRLNHVCENTRPRR